MKTHFDNTDSEQITGEKAKSYPDCLIIECPELKSRTQFITERIFAALLWGYWLYLLAPLISLLMSWLGWNYRAELVPERDKLCNFAKDFRFFFYGIVALIEGITIWSFYNFKRYGALTRRKEILETDAQKMAASLNVSIGRLTEIQQAKRITFIFSDDDSIKKIKTGALCHHSRLLCHD